MAELTGLSRSTLRLVSDQEIPAPKEWLDATFGSKSPIWLAKTAELVCEQFLVSRGWQVARANEHCVYDIFAIKNTNCVKFQVKSSSHLSGRGWPYFSLAKKRYNKRSAWRYEYTSDDFDYWFFYHDSGDGWIIPFGEVEAKTEVSMEGYDHCFIGRFRPE